jgi:hypothetical protein
VNGILNSGPASSRTLRSSDPFCQLEVHMARNEPLVRGQTRTHFLSRQQTIECPLAIQITRCGSSQPLFTISSWAANVESSRLARKITSRTTAQEITDGFTSYGR